MAYNMEEPPQIEMTIIAFPMSTFSENVSVHAPAIVPSIA